MNNDNRYQRFVKRMHFGADGLALQALFLLSFIFLLAAVGYAAHLDVRSVNPFGILSIFTSALVFAKVYFPFMKDEFKRDVQEAFWVGMLKTGTGVWLVWTVYSLLDNTHIHDLDLVFWLLLSAFFFESGIRSICHAVFLVRRSRKNENERKRLEEEMAAKWAAEEAERKRKAAIEEDLLADLNSYLSET